MSVRRSGVGLALGLFAAVQLGLAAMNPGAFVVDDAYFYLQIARNQADGLGPTFHGLGPTNGFHPLWGGLALVPAVLTADRHTQLILSVIAYSLLVWGGLEALDRAFARLDLRDRLLGLSTLAVTLLSSGQHCSEAGANMLGQGLVMLALVGAASSGRGWWRVGLAVGVMVLARLDLVFVAATVAVGAMAWPGAPSERLRRGLQVALGAGLLLLPYLLWNQLETGHMMPVSGGTKSTFPGLDLDRVLEKWSTPGVVALLASSACLALVPFARGVQRLVLFVWGAGSLAQVLYTGLFTRWGWSQDYDYYYLSGYTCVALLASLAFERFRALLPSFSEQARDKLGLGLTCLLLVVGTGRAASQALAPGGLAPDQPVVRFGRWMDENLPKEAVIFTVDAPGRLAWYSRRPVLAADGLTHGWSYDEDIRRDWPSWLEERGVTHVVGVEWDYDGPWLDTEATDDVVSITVIAPRSLEPAGVLEVDRADALVHLDSFVDGPPDPTFAVGVWEWEAVRARRAP